ncbi:MAG: hypothetical protein BWY85_02417 [Firmicutes bacterium ADurb.Bin506]|nr:MAG: hypothetical protein BWY85_02417 [Firmicutes bacterium ADurb.Bin506]
MAEAMQMELNDAARNKILRDMQARLASAYYHIPLFAADVLQLYRDDKFTGWVVEPDSGVNNTATLSRLTLKGGK